MSNSGRSSPSGPTAGGWSGAYPLTGCAYGAWGWKAEALTDGSGSGLPYEKRGGGGAAKGFGSPEGGP